MYRGLLAGRVTGRIPACMQGGLCRNCGSRRCPNVICCLFCLPEAAYLAEQRGIEISRRITDGCLKPAVQRAWEARSSMLRCHTPAHVIRALACYLAMLTTEAVQRGGCQELPFTLSHLSLAGNELTSLAGLALPALTWLDVSSNSIRARRLNAWPLVSVKCELSSPMPVPKSELWMSWLVLTVAARKSSLCRLQAAMMTHKCWMCCRVGSGVQRTRSARAMPCGPPLRLRPDRSPTAHARLQLPSACHGRVPCDGAGAGAAGRMRRARAPGLRRQPAGRAAGAAGPGEPARAARGRRRPGRPAAARAGAAPGRAAPGRQRVRGRAVAAAAPRARRQPAAGRARGPSCAD